MFSITNSSFFAGTNIDTKGVSLVCSPSLNLKGRHIAIVPIVYNEIPNIASW